MADTKDIGIRYAKNGDIETYNKKTDEKIGNISTMGNFIEETQEDKDLKYKSYVNAMKKAGFKHW